MMPSTNGSGHYGAQPDVRSVWLSDLMACYDFGDWRVAEECPEAFSGVRSDEEQAITDALMRYYNH